MTGTPCAREKSVDRSSDDRKRKRSGDTMAAPKKGKIGKLKYGPPLMNIQGDRTQDHSVGLCAWDDEGVPAQCTDIIKDGKFRGYLSNRETAHLVGLGAGG